MCCLLTEHETFIGLLAALPHTGLEGEIITAITGVSQCTKLSNNGDTNTHTDH